ncbi:MAG: class I SAM-dependent methyltransferase [Rhodanobacteraceae bacterium]|nr:MAG: class I SAM-dependent methyltransferase [Rhodanobacteraceae bacterium]
MERQAAKHFLRIQPQFTGLLGCGRRVMYFDYERDTKKYYQNDLIASRYHRLYTASKGLRTFPFRFVARREQRIVGTLLGNVVHRHVLDIPAGTGKLADVFARSGSHVVACDVSSNMLEIAKKEYLRINYANVEYAIADAVNLNHFADATFDVVVCLRLLHRVPPGIRCRMLREFSRVAPFALVSYGIDTAYHNLRERVRNKITGCKPVAKCFCSLAEARREIEPFFEIQRESRIARGVSRELVFSLKSRVGTTQQQAAF